MSRTAFRRDYVVVGYATNPFDESQGVEFAWKDYDRQVTGRSLSKVRGWPHRTIVTWNASRLARHLDLARVPLPQSIIDVCEAERLIAGQPRRSRTGRYLQSLWTILQHHGLDAATVLRFRRWAMRSRRSLSRQKAGPDSKAARQLVETLDVLWQSQFRELHQRGEADRFFDIEVPCIRLLAEISKAGIAVSEQQARRSLDELDKRMASTLRRLLLDEKVNPEDDRSVFDWLANNGHKEIVLFCGTHKELLALLRVVGKKNVVAELIRRYRQDAADRRAILRLGVIGEDRVFPTFRCMGTVTGRIIAADPHLQFVKKANRRIIVSDNGAQLAYPDYVNFEPCIVADECGDPELQASVSEGTLYAEYAAEVLGDSSERGLAKLILLSYFNGMNIGGLGALTSSGVGLPHDEAVARILKFLRRFSKLEQWRDRLFEELKSAGRVGSRSGNFRYRERTAKRLLPEEFRWAVNQRVQGTASLILKRVMLAVEREVDEVGILMPMHDALLCQYPAGAADVQNRLAGIFSRELATECPSIKPSVSLSEFSPVT
jgi:DNA polymerase I-like protein with 3'-5' exonuclease and polymerase domains